MKKKTFQAERREENIKLNYVLIRRVGCNQQVAQQKHKKN